MTELYMIAGPAGSGKTTLGVALARRLGFDWLDLDDVTEGLVSAFLAEHPDLSEADALRELREDRYAELAEQARRAIRGGTCAGLVLIAPFTAEISSTERWAGWLRALGVPEDHAHLVWLTLPPDERLARMAARGATRDAVLLAQTGSGADLPAGSSPVVPCRQVDARLATADQLDMIL